MYHIKMLQCSCYGISNYRIRLQKSCLQLEKIVTLDLVSTDLEYCRKSESDQETTDFLGLGKSIETGIMTFPSSLTRLLNVNVMTVCHRDISGPTD
jgi:hypothetical protein